MTQDNLAQTQRIIVDNLNRPMDVRPGVNRLLQRIDDVLLTLPEGQTLYVAIGENHTSAFDQAFFDAATREAKKRLYSLGLSLEDEFDTLYRAAQNVKPSIKPYIKKALLANDPSNKFAINAKIAMTQALYAPVAIKNSFVNVLRSNLPINLHDLSAMQVEIANPETGLYGAFDQEDETTQNLIASIAPQNLGSTLYTLGNPTADLLRNTFAFNSLEAFAEDKKLRVVFVKCGAAHLCGTKEKLYTSPPEDSLNGIANDRNHTMISVIPSLSDKLYDAFGDSMSTFESDQIIELKNSDNTEFSFKRQTTEEEEITHLGKISAASEGAFKLYNLNAEHAKASKIVSFGKINAKIKQAQTQTKNMQRIAKRGASPT